jgi:hypothetical protein
VKYGAVKSVVAPRNTILLENLTDARLVEKFGFYGTQNFVVQNRPPLVKILNSMNQIHRLKPYFTYAKVTLVVSFLLSRFVFVCSTRAACAEHRIILDLMIVII